MENRGQQNGAGLLIGGVLILLGIIFLSGQLLGNLFRIDFGPVLWPFFVILPGIVILGLAMAAEEQAGEAMAIIAGIVSMTGLLLFFQNVTGLWATWAYAWALVAPTGAGLGLMLWAALRGRQDKVDAGKKLAGVGVIIFLVGAVFFELVVGISGFGMGRFGWPALLIALGLAGLYRGLRPRNAN